MGHIHPLWPQTSRFTLISHLRPHTGEEFLSYPVRVLLSPPTLFLKQPQYDKSYTRSDAFVGGLESVVAGHVVGHLYGTGVERPLDVRRACRGASLREDNYGWRRRKLWRR